MAILDRRLLGPIRSSMGGNISGSTSNSGGGSGVTINNNVDGYLLQATGEANTIAGVPQLQWNSGDTALSASADIYVSGSNNYLYLHGVNADGQTVRFRVNVQGDILKVVEDSPEGSI